MFINSKIDLEITVARYAGCLISMLSLDDHCVHLGFLLGLPCLLGELCLGCLPCSSVTLRDALRATSRRSASAWSWRRACFVGLVAEFWCFAGDALFIPVAWLAAGSGLPPAAPWPGLAPGLVTSWR